MIVDGLLSLPAIAKEWTVVLKKHPGASLGMDVASQPSWNWNYLNAQRF